MSAAKERRDRQERQEASRKVSMLWLRGIPVVPAFPVVHHSRMRASTAKSTAQGGPFNLHTVPTRCTIQTQHANEREERRGKLRSTLAQSGPPYRSKGHHKRSLVGGALESLGALLTGGADTQALLSH